MKKAMALCNIRHASTRLADVVTKHPLAKLFFVNKLVEKYYQPMAADHQSVRDARLHAILAAAATMDLLQKPGGWEQFKRIDG